VACSLALRPARALLGDRIVAALACRASAPAEAVTFQDASLMLELRRLPAGGEPARVFPNRGSIARGDLHVRTAPSSRERLGAGQTLTRDFDLVGLYPEWVLDPGTLQLSYQVGPDSSALHAGPATVTIESGPDAVTALFAVLEHPQPGVRARAAGLLHRMTGHVAGYGAEAEPADRSAAVERWRQWWKASGARMPWNYGAPGATFGPKPAPPPPRRRSQVLGGIAYQRRPLEPSGASAISAALDDWKRSASGDPAALRGRSWIADQLFSYPGDEVVLDPGAEVGPRLESTLSRLAQLASSAPPDATGAAIILATVARFPEARFVAPLSMLQTAARAPAWRRTGFVVDALLDVLDQGRTPSGRR
jgi:hypothetical protein